MKDGNLQITLTNRFLFSVIMLVLLWSASGHCTQMPDLDELTEKALRNAHDVKLSGIDVTISRADRRKAYSLYYPTLNARWNSEHVRDLTDGTAQVTAVGNTVLVQNTMYQNSFSVASNYNLFDFGSTTRKVLIAEKDVDVKRTVHRRSLRDVKVKVLNIYTDLLTGVRELESKKELLSLYKEMALAKERLFGAGVVSRIDMVDDAIKVVKTVDTIDGLKLKVATALQELSLCTGETYVAENIRVPDFREHEEATNERFDPEKSPESRAYKLEIEKKTAEMESLEREMLPQVGLYWNYVWYGTNPDNHDTALMHTKPRNFFVGLSATLPLFDGFKKRAEIEKARLEIARLKLEKQKKLAELETRYAKLSEAKLIYTKGVETQRDLLNKTEENLTMAERLARQKIIEWVDFLNHRIYLVNQKFELAKATISRIAAGKELRILSEANN